MFSLSFYFFLALYLLLSQLLWLLFLSIQVSLSKNSTRKQAQQRMPLFVVTLLQTYLVK